MSEDNDTDRITDLQRRIDEVSRTADLIHSRQLDLEQYSRSLADKGLAMENRRYSLDRALNFYKNSVHGIICAEAAIHLADMFRGYVETGKLPDLEQARESVSKQAHNVVQHTFPPSVVNRLGDTA